MLGIKRWVPLGELTNIQDDVDELFKTTLGHFTPRFIKGECIPAIESFMDGKELTFRADIPGIDPKDIDVSLSGNKITIKGERKDVTEKAEGDVYLSEVSYGSFSRTFTLPEGVKGDSVHATYDKGVLEVRMTAEELELPKKIDIKIGEGTKEKVRKVA